MTLRNMGLEHLAIIMDGNGRWASERGLSRSEGHRKGYEVFRTTLEHLVSLQVPEVSYFALSTENLTRPVSEVSFLMQLFLEAVHQELKLLQEKKIRVRVVGNFSSLPQAVCEAIELLHQQDMPDAKMQMNLCFAYSGQWHIEHAFQRCHAQQGNLDDFRNLLMKPFLKPIDLLIRSGDVSRVSNFALWQLAYAELTFLSSYWPDITPDAIDVCLQEFRERKRRFGQVV